MIKIIEINTWMNNFLHTLQQNFAERVWFVGLQGSYARGEATDTSDIDIVVILDELSALDIQAYNDMIDTLPNRELVCGFLSGKEELLNWEASDLFQFYYDTKPIMGSIDELISRIDTADVDRAIKIGTCNIYHGCIHNMLHEKSKDVLHGLYKSASFVVQAICFKKTGEYITHQIDLLRIADEEEKTIVQNFLSLKKGDPVDFTKKSEALFQWSKKWIQLL